MGRGRVSASHLLRVEVGSNVKPLNTEPASDSTSEPAAPAQANDAAAVDLAGPVEEAEAAPEADADADADTTTETASAPTPTKSGKKGKKGKGN